MKEFENPISHACTLKIGDAFLSINGKKPENFCDSAWSIIEPFVKGLANGINNFYYGWMKNPNSAMISCNDGFRPVSFISKLLNKKWGGQLYYFHCPLPFKKKSDNDSDFLITRDKL